MPALLNALQNWKIRKIFCVPIDMGTPCQIYIIVILSNPIVLLELQRQLKRKQLKKVNMAFSHLGLSCPVVREKAYVDLPNYYMLLQGKATSSRLFCKCKGYHLTVIAGVNGLCIIIPSRGESQYRGVCSQFVIVLQ